MAFAHQLRTVVFLLRNINIPQSSFMVKTGSETTMRPAQLIIASLVLTLFMSLMLSNVANAAINAEPKITLHVDDKLRVSSDKPSIQRLKISGNLTTANYTTPTENGVRIFDFSSTQPNQYVIELVFFYTEGYSIFIQVLEYATGQVTNYPSYFVSQGNFTVVLQLNVERQTPVGATRIETASLLRGLISWSTEFGNSFPTWVKILYVILGIQFLLVGQEWMGYENYRRRSESSLPVFDRGNKLYLWTNILCKFQLTVFTVTAILMVGQVFLVYLLRYMFLIALNLVSLWDLFVLGFMAGMTAIAYATRMILERHFDLKPIDEE